MRSCRLRELYSRFGKRVNLQPKGHSEPPERRSTAGAPVFPRRLAFLNSLAGWLNLRRLRLVGSVQNLLPDCNRLMQNLISEGLDSCVDLNGKRVSLQASRYTPNVGVLVQAFLTSEVFLSRSTRFTRLQQVA